MDTKEIAIIGKARIGKTTLANALLGWDILPQSNDGIYIPTIEATSRMLSDGIRLIDTPGYDYIWNTVPDDVIKAISRADTIIVLLDDILGEDGFSPSDDPEWEKELAAEEIMLSKLLSHGKNCDIYFVIPYDTAELSEVKGSLSYSLQIARERFSAMTTLGDSAFFCIEPMRALIGAIEADDEAIAKSGILPLKSKLLEEKVS